MAGGRLWTPEEDEYLIENYTKLGRKACADHLKRPINGVKCRAYTLGIQANVAWPEREENLLIEMYPKIGRAGCAKLLPGRTIVSIGARAGFLGLTNDKRHAPTPNEIEVIRANYLRRGGRKKCAQLLPHFTPSAISHLRGNWVFCNDAARIGRMRKTSYYGSITQAKVSIGVRSNYQIGRPILSSCKRES
jgi:hypothetical protein